MNLVNRLLSKNTSKARIAGFILSNFIGLLIICGAVQFYMDARSIWSSDDSFIHSDYLVLNRRVTSSNTVDGSIRPFSESEIKELESQPWVRSVGKFVANGFKVRASFPRGGHSLSSDMFFEAIPDEFIDVATPGWRSDNYTEVPVIIPKDYLTLYNFGFAGSTGMPQISEQIMSGLPLNLTLESNDGSKTLHRTGRIVGYSNRLNTILVPKRFLTETNLQLCGSEEPNGSTRLIVDVSSPGDIAINDYLESHDLEQSGDKTASQASFLLKIVTGIVMSIGIVITLLSFFILLLSISLLMEKNRDKIHSLLMLGYPTAEVASPYNRIIARGCTLACLLALCGIAAMRLYYLQALKGLGGETSGILPTIITGVAATLLIVIFNLRAVRTKVLASYRR